MDVHYLLPTVQKQDISITKIASMIDGRDEHMEAA
jgi:hypothetical protein